MWYVTYICAKTLHFFLKYCNALSRYVFYLHYVFYIFRAINNYNMCM